MAFAALGEGDKAVDLFALLNPINHTRTRADVHRYKVEPYVVAADVYAAPPHVGRGGWTWYTGLGRLDAARRRREHPRDCACGAASCISIPASRRRGRGSRSRFGTARRATRSAVENPDGVGRGIASARLDGTTLVERPLRVPLADDGATHLLLIELG